jgi:hypothetical protein
MDELLNSEFIARACARIMRVGTGANACIKFVICLICVTLDFRIRIRFRSL